MRFDVLVVWTSVFILLFGISAIIPEQTSAAPMTETGRLLALTGYFSESIEHDELQKKYDEERVSILIVPGHDDENVGAIFNGLQEVDLNRELAKAIVGQLSKDDSLRVVLASTDAGWHPTLETFLEEQNEVIKVFESAHKSATQKLEPVLNLREGMLEHNHANKDVVHSLYGINKFANEYEFDIVLHVHFNDYPGRPKKKAGEYEGFSIYTPLAQFSNGRASLALARELLAHLSVVQNVSTLPIESTGILEDGELIAVGAFNTVDAVALLVEYGFIYEPKIFDSKLRVETFDGMAEQTARAIKSFLSAK